MKKTIFTLIFASLFAIQAQAQDGPKAITLDEAIQIAISENASVKVADLEIERTGYARKGTYASLFPKIDGSGSYQRTIKKQVMYMDFNLGGAGLPGGSSEEEGGKGGGGGSNGIEMGRWNTWSAGVSASVPLVNAQLWQSLRISDQDVELAVEKARSSRLETVTQVKKAYYTVLLAKEAFEVYKSVYENALANLQLTEKKYNAQRASELDLTRAKTNLANAIPNVVDSENSVQLGLWQLKAVMGVDLDTEIDVVGTIGDYAGELDAPLPDGLSLDDNSTLRQLAIQAEQLAGNVKLQQYANIPSLALAFSYSLNAMANDYVFKDYRWSPYSYVGLSLSIPIFNGGKRYFAIRQARVQAAQLDIQRANTERQLQIAIRSSLSTMGTATKSYASASSAVETAEKAYGIANQSYEVGRSTLTDLNDAQLALTRARLGVCQAIFSYLSAKSDLEGTLGADFLPEKR
ncbi:MAG: TolC family protein [Bacteroidales bacterium]|nr:TolC family protein [Bacteroidales bacterium]